MTSGRDIANGWADKGSYVPEGEGPADPSLSSTLMRGLDLLACFRDSGETLSNSELAARLELNRPTVSRLCKTLVHMGYLRRDPKGTFRLAPKILSLSYPVLSATRWRHSVVGPIRDFARMSEGNAALAVMSGDEFVQILTAGEPTNFPHVPEVGITGPLHRSASGRALLSMLQGQEFHDKMAELRALHPAEFEAHAETTANAIERCRREGFCISYGEWRPNIVAAAAPLGETPDGLRVALTCSQPRFRAREEYFETELGPRLVELAENLRLMGVVTLRTEAAVAAG